MSGLAKIFLVINLVLAVVFLGTSATLFSVRKDWKEESEKLQKHYEETFQKQSQEVGKLAERLQVWTDLASVQHAEIVSLKASAQELNRKLAQLDTDLDKSKSEIAQKSSVLEQRDGELAQLNAKITSLASTLQEAVQARETALVKVEEATALSNQNVLEAEQQRQLVAALTAEKGNLEAELEEIKIKLDMYERGLGDVAAGAMPVIKGMIMGVRNNLVVLSVGEDDGVRPGMPFMVSRGDTYVGDVKVRSVYKDVAGAEVTHTADGMEIREGDNASTKQY